MSTGLPTGRCEKRRASTRDNLNGRSGSTNSLALSASAASISARQSGRDRTLAASMAYPAKIRSVRAICCPPLTQHHRDRSERRLRDATRFYCTLLRQCHGDHPVDFSSQHVSACKWMNWKRAHDGALARTQSERRKSHPNEMGNRVTPADCGSLAGEALSQSASSLTPNALTCGT